MVVTFFFVNSDWLEEWNYGWDFIKQIVSRSTFILKTNMYFTRLIIKDRMEITQHYKKINDFFLFIICFISRISNSTI